MYNIHTISHDFFLNLNQYVVPHPVLTAASWATYRFLRRQVKWSGIPISFRIFQFIVIHTVKDFGIVNKTEVGFLWNSLAFSTIQQILAIWSLVPLPFLNPAWTAGISYCWSLAWRILSITLLACEMCAIVFEHSLVLPFFGIGMKTDLSSRVATAEFSKFTVILSAALSQHHLSGFERAQLEFHHLH